MTSIPRLSRREIKRLLNSKLVVARLATTSKTGKPHVVPVWFVYSNNKVWVPSPSRSLKAKNISRTPYASVVIDTYDGILNAKGLLGEGKAVILRRPESYKINFRIHQKYVGSARMKRRRWREFAAEDDVTIVVEPTKWKSWDFSKLRL